MNTIFKGSLHHRHHLLNYRPSPQSHVITLCKLGKLKETLLPFFDNPSTIPPLDCPTHSSLLQLCIDSNAHAQGRALHCHLLSCGHTPNLYLSTKLIIFYSKVGDISTARTVFDGMPDRSVVSWTAMISGYLQNGHPLESLEAFVLMGRCGFKANQFTFGSILRVCSEMGSVRIGEQIHGCIAKTRFVEDLFVQSALVDLHLKIGSLEEANCLFGRMASRDVVLWNSMIRGHADRGLCDDVFGLFCSMLRDGLQADHFTFGSILRACGGARALAFVTQIHSFIVKLGYGSDGVVTGSLIDAYAKSKSLRSARQLYDSMPAQDLICSTALITGYSQERSCTREALELFLEMNRIGIGVDDVLLCSLLNICANAALVTFGRLLHARAIKHRPNFDVAMGNALIDMYAKSGEIKDAHCAFDELQQKNVISWTSLITGYGKHGNGDTAIKLFERMENHGLKPNDVTFLSILSACSHTGLTSKGVDYFYSMKSYGVLPRAEHYCCIVDLLARGGQLKEAYDFVCRIDIKHTTSLWGAMLGACRMHGNTSLGEVVSHNLFDLDPQSTVNYVVLANIYAAAGFWEDAWKTRRLMERVSLQKDAGWSII